MADLHHFILLTTFATTLMLRYHRNGSLYHVCTYSHLLKHSSYPTDDDSSAYSV